MNPGFLFSWKPIRFSGILYQKEGINLLQSIRRENRNGENDVIFKPDDSIFVCQGGQRTG